MTAIQPSRGKENCDWSRPTTGSLRTCCYPPECCGQPTFYWGAENTRMNNRQPRRCIKVTQCTLKLKEISLPARYLLMVCSGVARGGRGRKMIGRETIGQEIIRSSGQQVKRIFGWEDNWSKDNHLVPVVKGLVLGLCLCLGLGLSTFRRIDSYIHCWVKASEITRKSRRTIFDRAENNNP